jgi:hypothetical protein
MANKILATLYPYLATAATAFGGPLGGFAAGKLGAALGLNKANPTEDELLTAHLGATEEQKLAAKKEEDDFALQMKAAGFKQALDLEAVAEKDRESARNREVSTKDSTVKAIAYLIILSFIGAVFCTLFGWSKAESVISGALIGYLSAKAEQVVTYYFGSSAGSDRKTELLAQSTPVK